MLLPEVPGKGCGLNTLRGYMRVRVCGRVGFDQPRIDMKMPASVVALGLIVEIIRRWP